MKISKRVRVKQFLIKYKELFNVTALERNRGFSRGIIAKFYKKKGNRKLKANEINQIDKLIQDMYDDYYKTDIPKKNE